MMIAYEICDFAIGCGDRDYWPASGGDTVELAWDNEPFKLRFERQPVQVGNAKRVLENGTFLIGIKAKACGEPARISAASDAYRAARAVTSDAGIVRAALQRFDHLARADKDGLLGAVRPVAAGAKTE